jgi:hypothetical protein
MIELESSQSKVFMDSLRRKMVLWLRDTIERQEVSRVGPQKRDACHLPSKPYK